MTIRPVQLNIENSKSTSFMRKQKEEYKSYLLANEKVETQDKVKPLPGQGHLIHDSLGNGVKYFFKDIAYDMKAVKDGVLGTANDHQLGRLNDVGLKLGGIGIAAYLASRTTNPKARLMEYIGLAVFLTSMSLYPKLAISGPARLVHGFDIDKQYIDDQGRKKSVFQDSNYIPYDLYRGETKSEDLDVIGDRLGIPRDIENRHDVIKEQMRKIATQNNTLWMLTAGLATPAMTALICCGIENAIGPALERYRNNSTDKNIQNMLSRTSGMSLDASQISENNLSKKVAALLEKYKGKELPKEELDNLLLMFKENLDSLTSNGLEHDLRNLLSGVEVGGSSGSIFINEEGLTEALEVAKKSLKARTPAKREELAQKLLPTKQELETIIKKVVPDANLSEGFATSEENVLKIKKELKEFLINKSSITEGSALGDRMTNVLNAIETNIKSRRSTLITDDIYRKAVDFAKIIGEHKEIQILIDNCRNMKIEAAPETVLARSYAKFEEVLFKHLGIKKENLAKMRESDKYTKEVLDKAINELVSDSAKYEKAISELGKVLSEMDVMLQGSSAESSKIADLVTAYDNLFNNTAKRLSKLAGEGKNTFRETIMRLVEDDVARLTASTTTREAATDFLDGLISNKQKLALYNTKWENLTSEAKEAYIRYFIEGKGSAKFRAKYRIFERHQGVINSMFRQIHTLEFYRRGQDITELTRLLDGYSNEYLEFLFAKGKDVLLSATPSDHVLKLRNVLGQEAYKDLMRIMYEPEVLSNEAMWTAKQKGLVTAEAERALGNYSAAEKGNLLDRFKLYIQKTWKIIANDKTDVFKEHHIYNEYLPKEFEAYQRSNMAMYNQNGQNMVDMAKNYANKKYGSNKWLKIMGGITASVFAVAILAQFGFGKLNNPQNLKKQVNDDTSK